MGSGREYQRAKEEGVSSEAWISSAPERVGPQVLLSSDEASSQDDESWNASKNPQAFAIGRSQIYREITSPVGDLVSTSEPFSVTRTQSSIRTPLQPGI